MHAPLVRFLSLPHLLALVGIVALAACPKKADEPQGNGTKPVTTTPDKPAVSNELCVGRPAATPEETLEIGGKKYTRTGSTLSLAAADADDEFVLGQVTDIKDHTAENAANLKLAIDWLKAEKVDAVAVTGDLGESAESIEKVLRDLATLNVPILTIIGNRECRDHFVTAVTAVQKDFKNVINMNAVRVFNTDELSVVSMPGYYNRAYLHCADGCEYTADDVAALPEVAKAATAPIKVLISHGPPQQQGDKAIDRIHEGANVGDPMLTKVLQQNPGMFPFGMFGNIQEAGGYATNLTGDTRVAADTYAESFYLNPGPLDSVRWVMLDQSESVGMAGLLKLKGKQAAYKIFRIKPGDAKRALPATADAGVAKP